VNQYGPPFPEKGTSIPEPPVTSEGLCGFTDSPRPWAPDSRPWILATVAASAETNRITKICTCVLSARGLASLLAGADQEHRCNGAPGPRRDMCGHRPLSMSTFQHYPYGESSEKKRNRSLCDGQFPLGRRFVKGRFDGTAMARHVPVFRMATVSKQLTHMRLYTVRSVSGLRTAGSELEA
jgi:hypothetical protein